MSSGLPLSTGRVHVIVVALPAWLQIMSVVAVTSGTISPNVRLVMVYSAMGWEVLPGLHITTLTEGDDGITPPLPPLANPTATLPVPTRRG